MPPGLRPQTQLATRPKISRKELKQPDDFITFLDQAGEFIVNKRFSNVQFYGSYVLSKLYGNFQGSYRSDNNQNDPNISSMFDFTNSDGRLTGQDIPGVLDTDRTHQFKLFANYMWHNFSVGASWLPTSGTPVTDLLDHPVYENAGEVPVCPNPAGTPQPLRTPGRLVQS